ESRENFLKRSLEQKGRDKGETNVRIVEKNKTKRVKEIFLDFCVRIKDAGEIMDETRLQRNLGVRQIRRE
ncbi:21345_t:CDS:1, partial [Rhizophagus irregularis]